MKTNKVRSFKSSGLNDVLEELSHEEISDITAVWAALWLFSRKNCDTIVKSPIRDIPLTFPTACITSSTRESLNALHVVGRHAKTDRVDHAAIGLGRHCVRAFDNAFTTCSMDWFASNVASSQACDNGTAALVVPFFSSGPQRRIAWPDHSDDVLPQYIPIAKVQEYTLDNNAIESYVRWYENRKSGSYNWIRAFESREHEHVLRVAGILAGYAYEDRCRVDHIEDAIALVWEAKRSVHNLLTDVPIIESLERGVQILLDTLTSANVRLSTEEFARRCRQHMSKKYVTAALNVLWNMHLIDKFAESGTYYWQAVGDLSDADMISTLVNAKILEEES